jgi:hypothetical protein
MRTAATAPMTRPDARIIHGRQVVPVDDNGNGPLKDPQVSSDDIAAGNDSDHVGAKEGDVAPGTRLADDAPGRARSGPSSFRNRSGASIQNRVCSPFLRTGNRWSWQPKGPTASCDSGLWKESVAAFRHGFDIVLGVLAFTERLSNGKDVVRKIRLLDDGVRPHGLDELVLCKQTTRMRRHECHEVEGLRATGRPSFRTSRSAGISVTGPNRKPWSPSTTVLAHLDSSLIRR